MVFTYLNYHEAQKEKQEYIAVTDIIRYDGNYPTRIRTFGPNFGTIDVVWEVTLSNNGSKDISIVSWDVSNDYSPFGNGRGRIYYSGLKQALLDDTFKESKIPISIKNGDSKKIYIRSALVVSEKPWKILTEKYEVGKTYDINEIIQFLHSKSVDIFGNAILVRDGGFEVHGDVRQQQVLTIQFFTGRGTICSSIMAWYPFLN